MRRAGAMGFWAGGRRSGRPTLEHSGGNLGTVLEYLNYSEQLEDNYSDIGTK
jgi:hypothetical protein